MAGVMGPSLQQYVKPTMNTIATSNTQAALFVLCGYAVANALKIRSPVALDREPGNEEWLSTEPSHRRMPADAKRPMYPVLKRFRYSLRGDQFMEPQTHVPVTHRTRTQLRQRRESALVSRESVRAASEGTRGTRTR